VAQSQLSQRQSILSSIQTVPAAEQRKAYVRSKLAGIFGTLPISNSPLNAQITNQISQAGFQIETVIFQSSSGYFVQWRNRYEPVRFPHTGATRKCHRTLRPDRRNRSLLGRF
jgi:hypothetical protein